MGITCRLWPREKRTSTFWGREDCEASHPLAMWTGSKEQGGWSIPCGSCPGLGQGEGESGDGGDSIAQRQSLCLDSQQNISVVDGRPQKGLGPETTLSRSPVAPRYAILTIRATGHEQDWGISWMQLPRTREVQTTRPLPASSSPLARTPAP